MEYPDGKAGEVAELLQEPHTTTEIAEIFGFSESRARAYISELRKADFRVQRNDESGEYRILDIEEAADKPTDKILSDLETGGLTTSELADCLDIHETNVATWMDELSRQGHPIEMEGGGPNSERVYKISDERNKQYQFGGESNTHRFALISDTHLGSQACHLDELHDFYNRVQEREIGTVLHAGDITDGYEVYRHHVNELESDAIGWDRLREYTVSNYPRRAGVTTHFISGNHDYKLYKATGLYLGQQLSDRREDLNWLGEMQATVVFDADAGIDFELIHPSGGTPYTVGYRAQTLYRERPPRNRPSIAGIGHLHDKMQAHAEGVEAFYTGCWQGPTPYIKRKGLPTKIGGWIVELEIESGEIRRMQTEWVGYEAKGTENEYQADELSEL